MGIIINALAIVVGSLIGLVVKKGISVKKFAIFGISVSIISLVSFIENVFQVQEQSLKGEYLYVLIFSLIVGYFVGDALKLDEKVNGNPLRQRRNQAFSEASMFFIIGGLQISGPILLGVNGDSSLLYLKSAIDFPFAVMLCAIYGKGTIFSAIPVALIQLLIAVMAHFAGDIISATMLAQLCSIGYVILFFSGMNMIIDEGRKISTINMLPSIPIIIIVNIALSLIK